MVDFKKDIERNENHFKILTMRCIANNSICPDMAMSSFLMKTGNR